jgi:anti-sigma factor RsiW
MMNAHRVTDDELHAYVDGQLEPDRRLAVERWLADDPEAQRRVEDYRTQASLLHEMFDAVLREPPTDTVQELTDKLRGRLAFNDNQPAWHARSWVRMAAAVALVVAGATGGYFGRGPVAPPPVAQQPQQNQQNQMNLQTFAEEATQAHRFYTSDERFQVEMGADNQNELNSWLSQRVGRSVFGPDLSRVGYRLIGGRSLPTNRGAGAQYMYVNDQNKRITLFVAPQSGQETSFSFAQNGDVATFYWVEGSLAYALIGRLSREELLQVTEAVYRDVREGQQRQNQHQGQPPQQNQQPQQPQPQVQPSHDQRTQEQPQPQQQNGVQPVSDTQKAKDS